MNADTRCVLVADPDAELRKTIGERLRAERLDAIEVGDGQAALDEALERRPDMILTELFLPDITGLNLCRRVRERRELARTPIVILTSYSDELDRITSFELGADDFVAKPVSMSLLMARIRAILRRTPRNAAERAETELALQEPAEPVDATDVSDATPRELQILTELMRENGRVVTREELVRRVWDAGSEATPRTVDAHIKSLRRKMGASRDSIRTIRGVGYSYEAS